MAHANRTKFLPFLEEACRAFQVPVDVLDAIIHCESAWNPWAVRYERQFAYLLEPEKFAKATRVSIETEAVLQRCSWGLCQIMGGTARDLGYTGALTTLLDPELNVQYGARLFARIAGDYVTPADQIAAYNAGSVRRQANGKYVNQPYVDRVLGVLATL